MAWTQQDLDTVRANMASGVLETRFADGRVVRYQSLDHLIAAEKVISCALTTQQKALTGKTSRRYARYRSGF